jgi:hypothetical protein
MSKLMTGICSVIAVTSEKPHLLRPAPTIMKTMFARLLTVLAIYLMFSSFTAQAAYMNYMGIWNTTTTYPLGNVITYNKAIYYSKQSSNRAPNKNKVPDKQPSWWEPVGTIGNTIHNGLGVPSTAVGNIGDFYLDVASVNLYGPKTTLGWPQSFVSLVGPQGEDGPQGPQGATGPAGSQGPQGERGVAGDVGHAGPAGPQGIQGENGANGVVGPAGSQGEKGDPGVAGPVGPVGNDGALGPKGDKGDAGPTGPSFASTFEYKTGDTGPGGGTIFFVDYYDQYPDFDYLEVAPEKHHSINGCEGLLESYPTRNTTSFAVGQGRVNTTKMTSYCNSGAAIWATDYVSPTGVDDWFLPSIGELQLMCNFNQIAGLEETGLWSSSWDEPDMVFKMVPNSYHLLGQCVTSRVYASESGTTVRPIRAF